MEIRAVHLLPVALGLVAIGAGPCGGGQSADTKGFEGTEKDVAQAVYDFRDAEVSVTMADIPGLATLWIDDVLHEVYPPRSKVG